MSDQTGANPEQMPLTIQTPAYSAKPKKKRGTGFIAMIIACCLVSGSIGSGFTLWASGNGQGTTETVIPAYSGSQLNVQNVSMITSQALSITEIADKVGPAVVSITIETTVKDRRRTYSSTGSGSGMIYTSDGYILTNHHVIDGADSIAVKLSTGNEYSAKMIGSDSQTDLAVLKIEADNLPCVTLGDSDNLHVGDLAVAIGNPLGELSGTVTHGIISATDREITIEDEKMNLLQTDAAINPGNSGGALCDEYGNVIGVVNAKTSALGVEGLGFAIPINDAKPVIEQLITQGYVSGRTTLGLSTQDVTSQTAGFFRVESGVYVTDVIQGGAADKAGVKTGDRIVSLGGQMVESTASLKEIRERHGIGDQLEIVVSRNGQTMTLTVTLEEAQ